MDRKFRSTLAFKSISPKWLGIFGWNFVWSISGTFALTDIKMKKKIVTELGHSNRVKIYFNPRKFTSTLAFKSIQMTYSETTAPMVLKFHLQHGKAAGLQNDKFNLVGNQKWPLLLKIAKPLKSIFFSRTTWYIWLKFCIEHSLEVEFQNYQNEKNL